MMRGNVPQPVTSPGCRRWLAAVTGILTIIEAGAAVRSLNSISGVAAQVSLSMPVEFIASVAWGVVSASVTLALVRGKPRALRYTAWLLIGFTVYSLARLAIFARADYDQQRLPFLVVAAFLILIVPVAFIVRPVRATLQPTENSANGRKPQD